MRKLEDKSGGKVDQGYTSPELIIPPDVKLGRRRLTAKYLRNEIYDASLNRTIVYYGTKTYIHCPTIYQYKGTAPVTLIANLFTDNHRVTNGSAIFKINNKTVTDKLNVTNGYLESEVDYLVKSNSTYQCVYEGSVSNKVSPARGEGRIVLIDLHGIELKVEVNDIFCANTGENTKLIARVHRLHDGGTTNRSDIVEGGVIKFYIDDEYVGTSNEINYAGFGYLNYTASNPTGVYEIKAEYVPNTDALREKYHNMWGSGTLFIGDDPNKPALKQKSKHEGSRGNTSYLDFEVTNNISLNGTIQLYLDNVIVPMTGTSSMDNHKKLVMGDEFTLDVLVPLEPTATRPWAYGGYHNFILCYTTHVSALDSKSGVAYDKEYWYYTFDDFVIKLLTAIRINTDEEDGDNLTIHHLDNNQLVHVIPRQDNFVIGDLIEFIVTSTEENNKRITEGEIEVTIKTRKQNTS